MAASPLLSVRNLKTYFMQDEGTVRAVDGVSFDVTAGATLGIVGESGCGKSVAMRAILQIVEPPGRIVGGRMLFRGAGGDTVDLARLAPRGAAMREIRGAEIALVPQEPMAAFSPVHTVGDQVIEALRLHERKWRPAGPGLSTADARRMTVELFRDVGISMPGERVDTYAWQLSGGLRQRAMIAMALVNNPRLVIADEPTTALDVTVQAQILELLMGLQSDLGAAIIIITHDLGVVAEMADKIMVMYGGKAVEGGTADQTFYSAEHPYTWGLLQSMPRIDQARQERLRPIPGNPPSGCAVHPRCAYRDDENLGCSTIVPEFDVKDWHPVRCLIPAPKRKTIFDTEIRTPSS
jgi:peptide/nickel transport system ATP-binding protein